MEAWELAPYMDHLWRMCVLATAALKGAGDSLVSNEALTRRLVVEQSGSLTRGHRTLSGRAYGGLAGLPPDDDAPALLACLTVAALLEEIGGAAARVVAYGGRAGELRVPPDTEVVDCLHEMALEAAGMTSAAVEAFLDGRSEAGPQLRASAERVRAGHRRVFRAATRPGPAPAREWSVWMVEIAQELERVASLCLAIAEKVAPPAAVAGGPERDEGREGVTAVRQSAVRESAP